MIRLPKPGGDDGSWGDILNAYLKISLNDDGTIKDNIVTNAKLDSSVQSSISKANSSEQPSNKDQPNGYAGLDGSGLIKSAELPASLASASQGSVDQALGNVSGTVAVNLSNGWVFSATVTANTTFNLTNLPASGTLTEVEGIITQGGSGGYTISFQVNGTPITVTWDTSVAQPASTQAGAIVIFNLQSPDAGTTWYGRGAPVRLDQANTWTLPQTFSQSIILPVVTAGTTTQGSVTTNNFITDTMAAAAMGIPTTSITEGMQIFDNTSQSIVIRGASSWDRVVKTGDTSGNPIFSRPMVVQNTANGGSANSIQFANFGLANPNASTPNDVQPRIRLTTDGSGNPEILLGPGSFSPESGFKRTGTNTITTVGVWVAQSGAPYQDATNAGGWTDATVTVGTVADGMHAVDTTNNFSDFRSGGKWWANAVGPREQDALIAQGWKAWSYDSMQASNNATLVSGNVYAVRIVMPVGGTVNNIVVGLFSAGSGFTAGQSAVGLYDGAGTLLSSSSDMGTSSFFGAGAASSGYTKPCPLTTPQALTAGQVVYAAFLATATTMPKFAVASGGVSGAYQFGASGYRRQGIGATGATSLPSTITPNALTSNSIGPPWVGLS